MYFTGEDAANAEIRTVATTANLVPIPRAKVREPTPTPLPQAKRVRWSEERRDLFDQWGPVALYVAGPKAPVPRGVGDNRLGWPLRFGITETFQDNITRMMDIASPYHWQGVWFRVWTPSKPHARALLTAVIDRLAPSEEFESAPGSLEQEIRRWVRAERARHSWVDVGEDFNFPMPDVKVERALGLAPLPGNASRDGRAERRFTIVRHKFLAAVRDLATSVGTESWDDDAVESTLSRMETEAAARDVGRRR